MSFEFLMTDHPAWRPAGSRHVRPATVGDGNTWLLQAHDGTLTWSGCRNQQRAPVIDIFTPPQFSEGPAGRLNSCLGALGAVARVRNPSLWDALATAIVRQVIRAGQARKLYREFSDRFGPRVALSDGTDIHAFPSAERMLTLSDADFTESGMAFKAKPLRRAARAFLAEGTNWATLDPRVLVKELQTVPGIGPWSAGAAVADWSNDWTLYPYSDLAVRTWARRADPTGSWPTDEPAFARAWRRVTGDQLGTYTLLTLAFGCHHTGAV